MNHTSVYWINLTEQHRTEQKKFKLLSGHSQLAYKKKKKKQQHLHSDVN